MRLVDRRERPLHDLRISITDRCNFRCTYCMPREHFGPEHDFLKREALLTYEEITTVVRALLPTGLRKVRLTGGEPLLRRDINTLIAMIREIGPDLDMALTTNGALLKRHAIGLREAGLDRVTVSLDAMDKAVFQAMADTTKHTPDDVLEGIDHATKPLFHLFLAIASNLKGFEHDLWAVIPNSTTEQLIAVAGQIILIAQNLQRIALERLHPALRH